MGAGKLTDKQLLFGVFCVQCGFAEPGEVLEAASAWASDPTRSVAQRLVEKGCLTVGDSTLVEQIVERAVTAHGGNSSETLASFGGDQVVRQSFGGGFIEKVPSGLEPTLVPPFEQDEAGAETGIVEETGIVAETGVIEETMWAEEERIRADCALEETVVLDSEEAGASSAISSESVTSEQKGRYSYLDRHTLYKEEKRKFVKETDSSELGRGGMGRVLVAFDHHIGREIAIKELIPERTGTGSRSRVRNQPTSPSVSVSGRFLREARVTGQLEHPAIMPVYEVGQRQDGTFYYAMRLVRGRTLRDAIRGCKSLADRLMHLSHVADLCHAIAYAHNRGVINRDIKSDNIMVGEFGETVVLDWGLAKVMGKEDIREREIRREIEMVDAQADGKTVAAFLGTPNYMSPEQARGDLDAVNELSDVWSIGAVLYETLTGKPPFEGRNALEVVTRVRTDRAVPVSEREPNAPAELAAIAMRCLEREPGRRYQSAKEVAEDIERFQSGARVYAYEYSSFELLRRFIARNRALSAAVVVTFIILVVSTILIARNYQLALEAQAEANYNYEVARSAREDARSNEKRAVENERKAKAAAIVARDNEVIARKKAKEAEDSRLLAEERLLLVQAAEQEGRENLASAFLEKSRHASVRRRNDKALAYAAVSLAYNDSAAARSNVLEHLSRRNYPHIEQAFCLAAGAEIAALSPSGKLLAQGGNEKAVRVWDLQTGREIAFLEGPAAAVRALVFLSDSVLVAGGEDHRIHVWNMNNPDHHDSSRRHNDTIIALAALSEKDFVSVGADGRLTWWNTDPLQSKHAVFAHETGIDSAATASKVPSMVLAGRDGRVTLWNIDSREMGGELSGLVSATKAVALSPNGQTALVAAKDGTLRIWRPATGENRTLGLDVVVSSERSLTLDPTGRQAYWGDSSGAIHRIDLENPQKLQSWQSHSDPIRTLIGTSPVGLLSVSRSAGFIVWDPVQQEPRIKQEGQVAFSLAFSSDGGTLATAGRERTIALWNLADGSLLKQLTGHEDAILSVAFSPDGHMLASAGQDGIIRLWGRDGTGIAVLEGHQGAVNSISFSRDSTLLVSAANDGTVRIWRVADQAEEVRYDTSGATVQSAVFSPDGSRVAWVGDDSLVNVWSVSTRKQVARFEGHRSGTVLYSVVFSPDGQLLASGGGDKTLFVWSLESGEAVARLEGHGGWINSVDFSPDGSLIASADNAGTVRLWAVDERSVAALLEGHEGAVFDVAFSPDGQRLATVGVDGRILTWNRVQGRDQGYLAGHRDQVNSLAVTPQGNVVVSAADDNTIRFWHLTSGRELGRIDGSQVVGGLGTVYAVTLSPDQKLIAAADQDSRITLWDYATRKRIARFSSNLERLRTLSFNHDGTILAAGGDGEAIVLWNPVTQTEIARFERTGGAVTSLLFERESGWLIAGTEAGGIYCYDVLRRQLATTLVGHGDAVLGMSLHHSGKLLATASADHTVRVWNLDDRREKQRMTGHTRSVFAVAFAPNSDVLASLSDDYTVRVWDSSNGAELARLSGQSGERRLYFQNMGRVLAFTPDGLHLVGSCFDRVIRIWDLAYLHTPGERIAADVLTLLGLRRAGVEVAPDPERLRSRLSWLASSRAPEQWWHRESRPAALAQTRMPGSGQRKPGGDRNLMKQDLWTLAVKGTGIGGGSGGDTGKSDDGRFEAQCADLSIRYDDSVSKSALASALSILRKLIAMRKSRATSRPQDLENRVALIEAYSRQASLYALLDDEIATREAMKTVLSLAQDTVLRKLPEVQRLAAATHAGLGEKAIRTEKHDDALFHHQQAIKLRRLIANRDGSGDIARMELANSHIALCETAQKMGDKAGVGRECQAGAAILESLVAADPEDMETTYLLTFCYFFLGETDKQYPLLKKLYDAQPENSSYGADLVETAFLSKRFDEVAAIAPDVYLLFGEADPDRVVLSVYWALASGMSGDVETASRVVAQAAQDVELLAGKPAWTFGGTLVVLRTWSGQDAKHALRIVLGLEEWSEKYARGPLQQALHDYMKLLRKQSE